MRSVLRQVYASKKRSKIAQFYDNENIHQPLNLSYKDPLCFRLARFPCAVVVGCEINRKSITTQDEVKFICR